MNNFWIVVAQQQYRTKSESLSALIKSTDLIYYTYKIITLSEDSVPLIGLEIVLSVVDFNDSIALLDSRKILWALLPPFGNTETKCIQNCFKNM
jgi:hypothetical protein